MPSDRFRLKQLVFWPERSLGEKALPLRNLAPPGPFLADLYEPYLAERSTQSDAVDVLDLDAQFAPCEVELIRPDCSAVVFI